MSQPLVCSTGELEQHFQSTEAIIRASVDAEAEVGLLTDWDNAPSVTSLDGAGCERIQRNRGFGASVAPLIPISSGLWAWLGFHEEWNLEPSAGKTRRFSFRTTGITVHLGYRRIQHKPQMFRAEWAGWARWNGSDYSYQAGGAGHPHWQFDAMDSLRERKAAERAAASLEILKSEQENMPARDFVPNAITAEDASDLVGTHEISRLHFASAAAWWKSSPHSDHAHAPKTLNEIRAWLEKTLGYVTSELARL